MYRVVMLKMIVTVRYLHRDSAELLLDFLVIIQSVILGVSALEKLHQLPISERIKYKVVCMCFNAINGSGLAYLSELLHVYTPSRTLRSSSDTRMLNNLHYKRKTHGFRAFSCFGPHILNSFSQDVRHCSVLSSFKAKLKTFLFSQYFHPN